MRTVSRLGFTLIEMSIVLTIVAMLIAAILAGSTLMQAASIQATLKQLNRYNAAVNSFRNKYGCLPGDCTIAMMTAFNLPWSSNPNAYNAANASWQYNNNGFINDWDYVTTAGRDAGIESNDVFSQLTFANLVEGTYSSTGGGTGTGNQTDCIAGASPIAFPVLANSPSTELVPMSFNATNYWRTGVTRSQNGYCNGSMMSERFSFTPADAAYISTKIDSGVPNMTANGQLQVVGLALIGGGALNIATDGNGNAIYGTAGAANPVCFDNNQNIFNTAYAGYACNLLIPAAF